MTSQLDLVMHKFCWHYNGLTLIPSDGLIIWHDNDFTIRLCEDLID